MITSPPHRNTVYQPSSTPNPLTTHHSPLYHYLILTASLRVRSYKNQTRKPQKKNKLIYKHRPRGHVSLGLHNLNCRQSDIRTARLAARLGSLDIVCHPSSQGIAVICLPPFLFFSMADLTSTSFERPYSRFQGPPQAHKFNDDHDDGFF